VLADGLGWQWIFWINVPIGLVLVPMLRRRLSESTGGVRRLDPLGAVLVAAGVLALVWGLLRAPGTGWAAGVVTGAALLGGFVWWEARVAEPMLALGLWRSRAFAFGNAASLMLYATLTGSVFLISQYLQVALGLSATAAGLRMLPWTATVLIAAPLSGRLVDRRGGRLPQAGGLALQAAGLLWIAYEAGRGGGYATFVAALTVAGAGVTAAMPAAQHAVFSGAGPADLGRASGTFGTLRQLGGVLGVTAMAAVFGAAGGSTADFRIGTPAALTFAAALSAAGALCGVLAYAGRPAATVQSVEVGERAGVR
jgi:MFS family permease